MITDVTDARLDCVDSRQSVILRMRGGELLVSTPQEANVLADLLRKAAWHLEQAEMLRASRRDRDAAQQMNDANVPAHSRYGTTLRGWPPAPVQRIPITACECTRLVLCDDHRDAS